MDEQKRRRLEATGWLARRLKSRPSHVAKMEDGDPSVTIDMLMQALLAMGVSPADIGCALADSPEVESLRRAR